MILNAAVTSFLTRCVLVYCGFQSYRAIDTQSQADDQHWLTFWMLYAFIQFIEMWVEFILQYIPFYFEMKLGLLIYLGAFRGAMLAYEKGGKAALKATEAGVHQVSQRDDVLKLRKDLNEKASSLMKRKPAAAPAESE